MNDWNSSLYLKFKNQRTQPAIDLAMRLADYDFKSIVDIGCGPGNSTLVLADLFKNAKIIGIDSSINMVNKAKQEHPELDFQLCDATNLKGHYDLIFSNACLQWIPDHKNLIPRLMDELNDKGILAVQILMNDQEPLFKLIEEIAKDEYWGFQNTKLQLSQTLTPLEYYNILTNCSSSFDLWETKYYHTLENHQALVDWIKSTRLRPYLDFLDEKKGKEFEHELVKGSKKLYPILDNGKVVLGFRRFFFVAIK